MHLEVSIHSLEGTSLSDSEYFVVRNLTLLLTDNKHVKKYFQTHGLQKDEVTSKFLLDIHQNLACLSSLI